MNTKEDFYATSMGLAVLAFFLLLGIAGCRDQHVQDYRYAWSWEPWLVQDIDFYHEGYPVNLQRSEKFSEAFVEAKELVKRSGFQEQFPYLNWELLEDVVVFQSEGLHLLNGGSLMAGEDSELEPARYLPDANILVMFAEEDYSNEFLMNLMVQQVFNILIDGPENRDYQLRDGFAVHYTKELGLYDLLGCVEEDFLEVLFNIFGEEDTVNMIQSGTLDEQLDELTEEGYGKKFNDALFELGHYYQLYGCESAEYDRLLMVEQDILFHAGKKWASNLPYEEKVKVMSSLEDSIFVEDEDDYFRKLLW